MRRRLQHRIRSAILYTLFNTAKPAKCFDRSRDRHILTSPVKDVPISVVRYVIDPQFRKRVHSGNVAWTSKDLLLIRISATYRATNEALRVGYNYGSMRHNFLKESMSQFFAKSRCTVESLSGRIVATTALRITLGLSTL